jgi:hypothetical protein
MINNNGLTNDEVIINRKKYGCNTFSKKKQDSFLKLLLETFSDPIIKILLIALGIKTVFLIRDFDWYETIGIVLAILIASFISSISEYGSSKAFNKLTEETSKINVRVKRNGEVISIPIDQVVVNDIVLLSEGDKVPADGVLISGNISVDESMIPKENREDETLLAVTQIRDKVGSVNGYLSQMVNGNGKVIASDNVTSNHPNVNKTYNGSNDYIISTPTIGAPTYINPTSDKNYVLANNTSTQNNNINLNVNGSLRLIGDNNSSNIDMNVLLSDNKFINELKDILIRSLNESNGISSDKGSYARVAKVTDSNFNHGNNNLLKV